MLLPLLPLPLPLPPVLVWKPVSASTTTVSVAAIFSRVRTIAVSPVRVLGMFAPHPSGGGRGRVAGAADRA
ncbi:hypothetical protein GCM10010305_55350 [Streptomyces termitum]|uniref:Uncharacterized protein n=1 Tax=Streptomyces termitum TaxID=67368 RepID=A0A918T773_9ACTN|nr:hypothetical protein GCM10010305_55350 [Streptomyces termitum]